MLFTPEWAIELVTPEWEMVRAAAPHLVCRKAASFLGYCRQQANKYGIKGSRAAAAKWASERMAELCEQYPEREKLGEVIGDVPIMEHVEIVQIPTPDGERTITHLSVCGRKSPYTGAVKTARKTYQGLWREYGKRAIAASKNENVDWKALSHAVRVGHQALELLATGEMTFPRPEADHLVRVKTGQIPYDRVAEEIENLLVEVSRAAEASKLADEPNKGIVENLIAGAYRRHIVAT